MTANMTPAPATNGMPPPRPKRRNYLWLWFFLILAVLAGGAIAFLGWYNLSLQLMPDQLERAWQLWKEKGPPDYDLEYTETGSITNKVTVNVRKGEVIYAEPDTRPLAEKKEYYGMDALFRYVERFLKMDAEPGKPRTYTRAHFDSTDGHLLHYVRRVMGTRERLEITVKFKAVPREGKP